MSDVIFAVPICGTVRTHVYHRALAQKAPQLQYQREIQHTFYIINQTQWAPTHRELIDNYYSISKTHIKIWRSYYETAPSHRQANVLVHTLHVHCSDCTQHKTYKRGYTVQARVHDNV